MKKFPVILDLETKYTFREHEKHKDLGISVVGIYDFATGQQSCFTENELPKLFQILENASYIIGYNIRHFDMQVLQAHYPGSVSQFTVFDICDDIRDKIGKRLSLGDLLGATLGKKKTGHGLIAIDLYKKGKWDELKSYCLDDVMFTKELFDFGVTNGYIHYLSSTAKEKVTVDWKKYLEDGVKSDISLTLPF